MLRVALFVACVAAASGARAEDQDPAGLAEIYGERSTTAKVMTVEAALALAQAEHGVIPQAAAVEICTTARPEFAPADALAAEDRIVRHRMVALLNVWRRSLSPAGGEHLHFGATTVDIYDTVAVMQMRAAIAAYLLRLRAIEDGLIGLAEAHRDTAMIGRTLGQHALPITFGKKVAVYIDENRRHMDRLRALDARLARGASVKGAVGSYSGLGEHAIAVEESFARRLGFAPPYPGDWRSARDLSADYALTLGLIARTWARFGQEVFLLQSTDIGELRERLPAGSIGSSTMPQKTNPSLSEALIHHGRVVPRLAEVVADDVVNMFERDNTSRPNDALGDLGLATERMLIDAERLIGRIEVDPDAMAANLRRTDGRIMAQRLVFALGEAIGRGAAEEAVRAAATVAGPEPGAFRAALLAEPAIAAALSPAELDALLAPETYLGLAGAQVDRVIAAARAARAGEPPLKAHAPLCADRGR